MIDPKPTDLLAQFCDWNARNDEVRTLHVQWLVRPAMEPLQNVVARIEGGLLTDVVQMSDHHQHLALPGILTPRFINAHTHLEFSALKQPLQPALPFQEWIAAVIQSRISRNLNVATGKVASGTEEARFNSEVSSSQYVEEAIGCGLQESMAGGVAAIGEITTHSVTGTLAEQFAARSVTSFCECIGLNPQSIDDQLNKCRLHLNAQARNGRHGLSPHAPYSVDPDLFEAMIDLASQKSVPVAMHLAETVDELQLLADGDGPFAGFLKERNLWPREVFGGGKTVLPFLKGLAKVPCALAIHCNYLNAAEQHFLAANPGISVVYCPRTHHFFGHQRHPWSQLKAAGVRVVLGTDSRASNPDLSIWKELQFVANMHPTQGIGTLLPMITSESARAIGLDPALFELRVGFPFDAVLLAVQDHRRSGAEFDCLQTASLHHAMQPAAVFSAGQIDR